MSPLYEYKCESCSNEETDRVYDIMVFINELDQEIKCPKCGNILRRLISSPNFVIN